ncbi:unnamed protein product, partial [Mesorhabditis belari]|uniref:Protein kinase domain-containing protein n=1 Tax=Mesorhabditis belari TaxID=2138241 RepID=A0AAF3ETJ0_9BILA
MHVVVEKDLYFTTKKHIVLDKDTHRVVKFYLIKDDYYYGVFKNETETLSKLVHPNIVSFLGTVMTPTLGIVMEYCERGPISKIIFQQEFEYSLRTILWWAEQLFRAICYLSERDIVHANINHENTLATGSFGLKLAGFGNSRREGEPKNDPITSASDVYSAVILIWEIVEKSEAQFDDEELKHRPFAAKFSHIKDIPLKEPSLFEKLQNGTQLEAKDRTPVFAALLTTKDLRKVRCLSNNNKACNTQNGLN